MFNFVKRYTEVRFCNEKGKINNSERYCSLSSEQIIRYREIFAKEENTYECMLVPLIAYTGVQFSLFLPDCWQLFSSLQAYQFLKLGFLFAVIGLLFCGWYQEAHNYHKDLERSQLSNSDFMDLPSAKMLMIEYAIKFFSVCFSITFFSGVGIVFWRYFNTTMTDADNNVTVCLKVFTVIMVLVCMAGSLTKNNLWKALKRTRPKYDFDKE